MKTMSMDDYFKLGELAQRKHGQVFEGKVEIIGDQERMPFKAVIPGFRTIVGTVVKRIEVEVEA